MANVFREGPGTEFRHRADEIHVHERKKSGSLWALLVLLALAAIALLIWGLARNRDRARTELPAVPAPELDVDKPQAPKLAPVPDPRAAAEPRGPEGTTPPTQGDPGQPPAAGAVPATPAESETSAASEAETETGTAADRAGSEAGTERATTGTTEGRSATEPMAATPTAGEASCTDVTIYFPKDSTLIGDEAVVSVNQLASCLKADPTLTVRLEGRADPTGSAEHNRRLATERALSVAAQLQAHGISVDQISAVALPSNCAGDDPTCWRSDRTVNAVLTRSE